jgi:hypothetical protein
MVAVPRQFESIDVLLCPCAIVTLPDGTPPVSGCSNGAFQQPLSFSTWLSRTGYLFQHTRRFSVRPFHGRPNRPTAGCRSVFSR